MSRRTFLEKVPVLQLPFGQEALLIQGLNLEDGDEFELYYALTADCNVADSMYAPYCPNGTPVIISSTNNPVRVMFPGFYKLVARGAVGGDPFFSHVAIGIKGEFNG